MDERREGRVIVAKASSTLAVIPLSKRALEISWTQKAIQMEFPDNDSLAKASVGAANHPHSSLSSVMGSSRTRFPHAL